MSDTQDPAREALQQAIAAQRGDEPLADVLARRGLGGYRGYAEMLGAIGDSGGRLEVVGSSVLGAPLFSVSFGSTAPDAPTSVVVASIHPNEWIGIETCLALMARIATTSLGSRALIVFPLQNPDGVLAVERNLRAGRRRFVRHNANGVDLNRNFDTRWGHRSAVAKLVPWVFKPGRHPASEPEVAVFERILGARRVDRALSLHSFGGVVLYPSAQTRRSVADAQVQRAWAQQIAARAAARPYRAITPVRFGFGITMGGLEIDWFHQRFGALSLLVECSRGGLRLSRGRLFDPFAWFNPPEPARVAARIADASLPFVRGDVLGQPPQNVG